jgi:hypothetical protein
MYSYYAPCALRASLHWVNNGQVVILRPMLSYGKKIHIVAIRQALDLLSVSTVVLNNTVEWLMMGVERSEVNETNYDTQRLAGQVLVLRRNLSFRIYVGLGIEVRLQHHLTFSCNILPFSRTHYDHNGCKLDLLTFSSQQPHVHEIRHAILHPSDGLWTGLKLSNCKKSGERDLF